MKAPAMHQVPVTLTKAQARRLMHGHTVQLAHENVSHARKHPHALVLHHASAKRVHSAARARRGIRLRLSPEEIHHSMGSGLFDWLKKAGETISNAIASPFYQSVVKPATRWVVDKGIDTFVPGGIARDVAHSAANWAGERTGAFGVRRRRAPAKKRAPAVRRPSPKAQFEGSLRTFEHPEVAEFDYPQVHNMNYQGVMGGLNERPLDSYMSIGSGRQRKRGGSFRAI